MSNLCVADLADTLVKIWSERKTGVLRIGTSGRLRMAFFEDGSLVYVVSDVPEENLAACFARAGRLERAHERLQLFHLEKEVTRKKTLVALVLERGLRDADTVREWLVEYAYELFARVFDTRDVSWKLMPGVRAEHPLPFSVPAMTVVLEAVRGMRDDEAIHEAVGPLSRLTRPPNEGEAPVSELPLSFYEGLVAARVTGPISVEELVAGSGVPEADALRAVLALRLTGAIAPFSEPKRLGDSGLLRLLETDDTGFVVALDEPGAAEDLFADAATGPVAFGELDGSLPPRRGASAPLQMPVRPRGGSAPLQYPPPRPRGDTSRLRLLASAYIQMGEAEAAAGNYAAAAQCFESALAQKPNDLATMLAYARVHAARPGGVPAAERLLEKACEAHPKAAAPRIQLARIYLATGRDDDADDILMEARRFEPGNAEVRALLDGLTRRAGGGLLARFGFRSEPKQKVTPIRPSSPAQSRPAGGDEPQLRCRYCGRLVQGEARICRSCGATL
jgi:hypothetical protein